MNKKCLISIRDKSINIIFGPTNVRLSIIKNHLLYIVEISTRLFKDLCGKYTTDHTH